ncbi:MAG: hypothetical protein RIT45_55 [Pseudomonadota bacterium]
MHAVLVTQCLQHDFVGPIGPFDALPNQLHIGHEEAERLLGPEPEQGPLAQLMAWARKVEHGLTVVHVRDWHDRGDAKQHAHLDRFDDHCLAGTPGAELVLGMDADVDGERVRRVDALTLNDATGSNLGEVLAQIRAAHGEALRVGVVGVWTEAKVTFLLYELMSRWGVESLATCSALCASSNRERHFAALDQLGRVLGVQICHSVGEFAAWLRDDAEPLQLDAALDAGHLEVHWPAIDPALPASARADIERQHDADLPILQALFPREQSVRLQAISGGFSGAGVYRVTGRDRRGHEVAATVLKLGSRTNIADERRRFELVEGVLGNDAPSVRGLVEHGQRAGLKYAYAAMGGEGVRTFKSMWSKLLAGDERAFGRRAPEAVLDTVFGGILGRFTAARRYEPLDLIPAYGFVDKQGALYSGQRVRDNSRRALADGGGHGWSITGDAADEALQIPAFAGRPAQTLATPARFYDHTLPALRGLLQHERHWVAYVHGDLNYANILVDDGGNVWVIDFAHAGRKHATRDLHKAESDLLFLLTQIEREAELGEAMAMIDALLAVQDLAAPLPETLPALQSPALRRCWQLLRHLRGLLAEVVGSERNPTHIALPMLCYAAQTIAYDEANAFQKRLALYTAARLGEQIRDRFAREHELRLDQVPAALLQAPGKPTPGALYLTLCPGRTDRGRDLDADIDTLRRRGVHHVVCLCSDMELHGVGVHDYGKRLAAAGITLHHEVVADQGAPPEDADDKIARLDEGLLARGVDVVVHCMGGLGRTGLLAAALLIRRGMDADAAIAAIRKVRSPRAIETEAQVAWLHAYAARTATARA